MAKDVIDARGEGEETDADAKRTAVKKMAAIRMMMITARKMALLGALTMASTAALAQAPTVDASKIPVLPVTAQPTVGEEILDQNGVLASALLVENRICTVRGCRVFIFDKRTGGLIRNDRVWAPAYAPTGRGGQVIRVKAFTQAELPQPAPDDKALETAPAIVKVTRSAAPPPN